MLEVKGAKYLQDYILEVEFSDSKRGAVDLKPFIFEGKIKPFEKLKDIEAFKKYMVDYTLKWETGLDLAPEYLYFQAFKDEALLQEKFKEWGYL